MNTFDTAAVIAHLEAEVAPVRVAATDDLTAEVANQYVSIEEVVLETPRLVSTVTDQFGSEKWVTKGYLNSEATAQTLANMGMKVYQSGDDFYAYFERKAVLKNGRKNSAVKTFDAELNAISGLTIETGAVANVRVYFHKYAFAGKSGVTAILDGIQVA